MQVRGIVGGLTTCACHFFIFLTVKSYNMFQTHLTKEGTFLMYGCISLLGTIFFYVYLPETKNKTLQEIEEQFAGKSKKHHSEIYVKPSQQKLILSSDDLITSEKPKAINGSAVAVWFSLGYFFLFLKLPLFMFKKHFSICAINKRLDICISYNKNTMYIV